MLKFEKNIKEHWRPILNIVLKLISKILLFDFAGYMNLFKVTWNFVFWNWSLRENCDFWAWEIGKPKYNVNFKVSNLKF